MKRSFLCDNHPLPFGCPPPPPRTSSAIFDERSHKKVQPALRNAPLFFPGSCEAPIRSCSYLFDVAAISERLLCLEKMEQTTSMITFMLWIENKKAKGTDNMFTSNGHTGCTCYCYGSLSSFMASRAKCYFSHEKARWGLSDIIGCPFCTHLCRRWARSHWCEHLAFRRRPTPLIAPALMAPLKDNNN